MKIRIADVISAACHYYGIPKSQFISATRAHRIAHARQVAMMLAREYTGASLTKVSGAFGGRDHTTVLHAISAVRVRCKHDPDYAATVETLRKRLHSGLAVEHDGPIEFWWAWCGDHKPKPPPPAVKPPIPVLRPNQRFLAAGMSRTGVPAQ